MPEPIFGVGVAYRDVAAAFAAVWDDATVFAVLEPVAETAIDILIGGLGISCARMRASGLPSRSMRSACSASSLGR
jgi:hypothetical protein